MIKKLKILLLSTIATLTLLVPAIAMPALAHAAAANIPDSLCQGANLQVGDTSCPAADKTAATNKINDIIGTVINIFSVVVGVIAVIMIIVGGIKFVLSGGDSAATGSARNTVLYAVVGLVVVALAQILVKFVLAKVNPST